MTNHAPIHPDCEGPRLSRRGALLGLVSALTLGGSGLALAQGLPGAAAGAFSDARFVVMLLRGALDGPAAVPAYGDPAFAALRGSLALPEPGQEGGVLDLGGRFGMHPKLARLHAAYRDNQALVVHAVAGPYRTRSHFDAQDMLESGAAQRLSSGWLNRALVAMPERRGTGQRGTSPTGLSVGLDVPLLLRGGIAVQNYAPPGAVAVNDDLMARIEGLLARDATLGTAFARGREERGLASATLQGDEPGGMAGPERRSSFVSLAGAAGRLLASPTGPRVAALEAGGFDTHSGQSPRLAAALTTLDEGLWALRQGLGEAWGRTAVLVLTEFGRTARVKGTGCTDHGTGGVALILGGAVAGGQVRGDWPGLGAGRLFEDRDLQPTTDVQAIAKGLLRDHLRLPAAAVDQAFPDSAAVTPMGGLVRA